MSYRLFAALSLLVGLGAMVAEGRPRYGGTLRVEMREAVRSIDPGDWPPDAQAAAAKERLVPLVFETLIRLDENSRPQPGLALSWRHDSSYKKWRFRLRPDVVFDDGSVMTVEAVSAALRPLNESWLVGSDGDVLLVDSDVPVPELPYDLADPSKSICLRGDNGRISGTGPFRVAHWGPGRRALLVANEQYWEGRPFLDSVAIEMGRSLRDQLLDLELNRADLVEIWPNEVRRLAQRGAKIRSGAPNILVALTFERGRPAAEDPRVREAVALSIDRAALHSVLLQKQGEPAAALLPQHLSGYSYLFSSGADAARARRLITVPVPPLVLAYDASDPIARAMAERIAVDARGAGLTLQVTGQAAGADMRLARLPIRSPLPAPALAEIASAFHLADLWHPAPRDTIESLYATEREMIDSHRIIPLLHLPGTFGSTPRLKSWATPGVCKSGRWRLDDMWLDTETP